MTRPPPPVPFPLLFDRVVVGALAALVVARPLAPGDDPGRLRLTAGGGAVSFNLCVGVVLVALAVWRAAFGRTRSAGWPVVPLLLAGVGVAAFASSRLDESRYARPGTYIAWEWVALAAAVYLTRRAARAPADDRGLVNVFLATAVSVAGLGVYQSLVGPLDLPSLDVAPSTASPGLAGNDEFYPDLNRPPGQARPVRGTFDSPETLFAFLLLAFPAALAAAWAGRGRRWGRLAPLVPAVVGLGGLAVILANPFLARAGHWSAALELIERAPALGVGPGNFSRMAPAALTPQGAWLGLAATTGLVGLGLFLAAVAAAGWLARPVRGPDPAEAPAAGTRWAFHLGGGAGLVLGFVWAFGEMPAETPPREVFVLGAQAVVRSVLWFAAFALLETVRPATRLLVRALLAGAALVFVFGLVSDAPGRPTILFPTFVLLTVAANLARPPAERPDGPWSRPGRVVAVLLAAGLTVTYLATACVPAWGTASAVRQARMASRHVPDRDREIDRARPGPARANALTAARNFLLANVVLPLQEAAGRDPRNAALWLEVAHWRRHLWQYELELDPQAASRTADVARRAAEIAGQLDPHNLAAKRNLFEALLLFRGKSTTRQTERIAALNKVVGQIAEREPASEVHLRHRMVRMLLDRKDAEGLEAEVSTLLRLNREEGAPHGSLTPEQKDEVVQRAIEVYKQLTTKQPPKELLDEWTR